MLLGMKVFNLQTVLAKAPATSLTATASARGVGFTRATMNASFTADLAASRWDSLAVDSGSARLAIANGLATVQRLRLSGAHTQVTASGTFGLVANRSGELRYSVDIDSLGAMDRLFPDAGPDTGVVQPRPAAVARAFRRARADSARIARAPIERLATGRPLPRLVVDDAQGNADYALESHAPERCAGTPRTSTRGVRRAQDVNVHGNAAQGRRRLFADERANASVDDGVGYQGRLDQRHRVPIRQSDAAELSRAGWRRARELLVRQAISDYGLKGDYVLSNDTSYVSPNAAAIDTTTHT
jgi:hypothetical protein